MWRRSALLVVLAASADPRGRLLERRLGDLAKGYEACFVLYDANEDRTLQVAFLRRLYRGDLPFDRRNVEIVKQILVQDEKDGVVFSGKTGSCDAGGDERVGWFVGRQVSPKADYIFATRIVGPDRGLPRGQGPDGLHAREISRGMLAALASR